MRAVALLAGELAAFNADAAKVCRTAESNAWDQRLAAFEQLLRDASRSATKPANVLVDIDALAPGRRSDTDRWDDVRFSAQREGLLATILDRGLASGLFILDRPEPGRALSRRLLDATISRPSGELAPWTERVDIAHGAVFPPVFAQTARWLLDEEVVRASDLVALHEARRHDHVLTLAWEHLRPSLRREAMHLSVVRAPMHVNGQLGPFLWDGDGPGPTVERSAVTTLERAGFLRRRGGSLELPRAVRAFVRRHAAALSSAETRYLHRAFAHGPSAHSGSQRDRDGASAEQHWHAIEADDDERAVSTARFYGASLRSIAVRAGQRGHIERRERRFDDANRSYERAASIFERIVSTYDPHDAYAWEYAGYNRWQLWSHQPTSAPPTMVEQIERFLEKACELAPINPLFRGRLLGFRAAIGREILTEFDQWLARFNELLGASFSDPEEQLTWLVEPVLVALRRRDATWLDELRAARPLFQRVESRIERRRAHEAREG